MRIICINDYQRKLTEHQLEEPIKVGQRARKECPVNEYAPNEDDSNVTIDDFAKRPRPAGHEQTVAYQREHQPIDGRENPHLADPAATAVATNAGSSDGATWK